MHDWFLGRMIEGRGDKNSHGVYAWNKMITCTGMGETDTW